MLFVDFRDMKKIPISRDALGLVVLLLSLPIASAHSQTRQSTTNDELFRTAASLESALFDATTRATLEKFGSFFAEDVEFYHDKGGVHGTAGAGRQHQGNLAVRPAGSHTGTLEVHPWMATGRFRSGALVSVTSRRACVTKEPVASASSSPLAEQGRWLEDTRVITTTMAGGEVKRKNTEVLQCARSTLLLSVAGWLRRR